MPFTLADYLNRFSWSQADLAREAGVSEHCVRRALAGDRIARRNAHKIVTALDNKFQAQEPRSGHITISSIAGLHLAELHYGRREEKEGAP